MLLTRRQPDKPAAAANNLCSIRTLNGLYTEFGIDPFLTRGKGNIRTELFFLALAFDLKKLWMKREHNRLKTRVSLKMVS